MTRLRLMLLAVVLLACETSVDEVRHTTEAAGFSNVAAGDTEWGACGEGDKPFGRHFVGTNPAGAHASGTVCCGMLLKGCTVRF